MADQKKNDRMLEIIRHMAAEFLQRESTRSSLITVTNANLSKDGKNSTVFFTVFPPEKEQEALDFAKRKRSEFREYVQEKSKLVRIPMFDFEIDFGEKNRQRIDQLSNN